MPNLNETSTGEGGQGTSRADDSGNCCAVLMRSEEARICPRGASDRRKCRARCPSSNFSPILDTGFRRHDDNFLLHRAGAARTA